MIQTTSGAIESDELGVVDVHEHLFARATPELVERDPDLALTSSDAMVEEVRAFADAGGRTIVDWTTIDYGRDVGEVARIAARAGIRGVVVTGFNKGAYCRPHCEAATPQELAGAQVAEIQRGVDGTGIRCAAVKFGTSLNRIDPWEQSALEAAALTHQATGCPVFTHTEHGTCAPEQLRLLARRGVPAERIVLAHLDHNDDLDLHLRIADTGAFIGYDQVPKPKYRTAPRVQRFVVELARRGLHTQIVIGGDLARRSLYRFGGGPGLGWLIGEFRHRLCSALDRAGLDASDVLEQIFIRNPGRALSTDA